MKSNVDLSLFPERLTELLNTTEWTTRTLGARLNLQHTTISRYANGINVPKLITVYQIAEIANVSFEWLVGESDVMRPTHLASKAVKIPVLGTVPAGIPIEAIEEIIDYEEIPVKMAQGGEYFALQIKGDSMEPKMSEGDVVIVRKQEDCDNGDVAIVMVNGNEATVKKIKKFDGGINLIPFNNAYDVITFSNKQIEELPVRIIGKVVELRAKY